MNFKTKEEHFFSLSPTFSASILGLFRHYVLKSVWLSCKICKNEHDLFVLLHKRDTLVNKSIFICMINAHSVTAHGLAKDNSLELRVPTSTFIFHSGRNIDMLIANKSSDHPL